MGTPKRERQKANKQLRQIEQARAERVSTVRRTATRITIIVVLAIVGVIVIAWLGGAFSDDDEGAAPTPTAPPTTATPATAPPAPDTPKPEVDLPSPIPDDLVVTTLTEGTGDKATDGDTVNVLYVGVRSEDGVEFDTNFGSGSTFAVTLGSGMVIQGWEAGLLGVQEGGRYQLDIPSELAYGETAPSDIIGENAALTFVIDVVSVVKGG